MNSVLENFNMIQIAYEDVCQLDFPCGSVTSFWADVVVQSN